MLTELQILRSTLESAAGTDKEIAKLDNEALKAEREIAAILDDGRIGDQEESRFLRCKTLLDLVPAKRARLLKNIAEETAGLPDVLSRAVDAWIQLMTDLREGEIDKLQEALRPFYPNTNLRTLRKVATRLHAPTVLAFEKRFCDRGTNLRNDAFLLARHARTQIERMQRVADELGIRL